MQKYWHRCFTYTNLFMKKAVLFCWFIAVLFLAACRSMNSFETPDAQRNQSGALHLKNGRKVDGKLVVQMGNVFGNSVEVYAAGEKKPMRFDLRDVEGYRIRNDYYALKDARGEMGIKENFAFMKRLTPEDSGMHLYEKTENNVTDEGNRRSFSFNDTEYYLQLPGEKGLAVYNVNSFKFVPHFHKKVSELLSNCRVLAQKIAAKEKGYFYPQLSLVHKKRAEVWLKIILEYNQCMNANTEGKKPV